MYKAFFPTSNFSEYFEDDKLLFIVKRKRFFFGFKSICNIYKENKLIFSFYSSLFNNIKILSQKLSQEVFIEKGKSSFFLIVNQHKIHLKFNSNPFGKRVCKIYKDDNLLGYIERKTKNSKIYFNFNFNQDSGLEYYALILFSMSSVGITDSI
jgi:hypothetical protein